MAYMSCLVNTPMDDYKKDCKPEDCYNSENKLVAYYKMERADYSSRDKQVAPQVLVD